MPVDEKNIVLVGNCQVQPIATILEMFYSANIVSKYLVHRCGKLSGEEFYRACDDADWIFTQPISDKFKVEFFRTNGLIDRYGEKVVRWANLYFKGYNPELIYLRGGNRLPGPLGDYHIDDILQGYLAGSPVGDVVSRLEDIDYNRNKYKDSWDDSLAEFSNREMAIDAALPITSFIRDAAPRTRLFYTFNHPANILLHKVARQLVNAVNLPVCHAYRNGVIAETLSDIQLPINPYIALQCQSTIKPLPYYVGLDQSFVPKSGRCHRKIYDSKNLIAHFYRLYDENQQILPTCI